MGNPRKKQSASQTHRLQVHCHGRKLGGDASGWGIVALALLIAWHRRPRLILTIVLSVAGTNLWQPLQVLVEQVVAVTAGVSKVE